MIEEILLLAMLGQMVLFCGMIWKMIQLDKKQQSTIFGVSHVWGAVMQVQNTMRNGVSGKSEEE